MILEGKKQQKFRNLGLTGGRGGGLWEPEIGRFWKRISHACTLPKAGAADLKASPLPPAPSSVNSELEAGRIVSTGRIGRTSKQDF